MGLGVAAAGLFLLMILLDEGYTDEHMQQKQLEEWMSGNSKQPSTTWRYGTWGNAGMTAAPAPTSPAAPAPEPRTEPIYGWRAFDLEKGKLKGLFGQVWNSGVYEAKCMADDYTILYTTNGYTYPLTRNMEQWKGNSVGRIEDGTLIPELPSERQRVLDHLAAGTCKCGLYGGPHTEDLDWAHPILARVLAYGTVLVDARGVFRASDVMVEQICINRRWMMDQWGDWVDFTKMAYSLSATYDAPVRIVETPGELEDNVAPQHGAADAVAGG